MTACGKLVTGYNSPDRSNPFQEHWVELRTGYPCSVETESSGGHGGPCAAVEQPQTVTARSRWLAAETRRLEDLRHTQSGLGETQGRPLTFAENVGADPAIVHPAQQVICPLCSEVVMVKDLPDHLRQAHGSTATTASRPVPPSPEPTRAHREHDQALPEPNERPVMHEVLIEMIQERLAIGIERYGTGLQPMNGRDALRDQVEELVDATVYTLQIQHERAEMFKHARVIYEHFDREGRSVPIEVRQGIEALVKWLDYPPDRRS